MTHLDVRDNQLAELDLSTLGSLEQLHCERNRLQELTLSGFSLRALYASHNRTSALPSPCRHRPAAGHCRLGAVGQAGGEGVVGQTLGAWSSLHSSRWCELLQFM